MTSSPTESLRAFVSVNAKRSGIQCRACALPEGIRAAVETIRGERASYSVISDWLKQEGHIVSAGTLAYHFRNHDGR